MKNFRWKLWLTVITVPSLMFGAVAPANAATGGDALTQSTDNATKSASVNTGPIATPASGFVARPVTSFSWSLKGITINVPAGCVLGMRVVGKKLKLDKTIAYVDCIGPAAIIPGMFCNWGGEYRFLNTSGKVYAREKTKVTLGCGQASFAIPSAKSRNMKNGKICLDFINNGTKRGTACMAVFQ